MWFLEGASSFDTSLKAWEKIAASGLLSIIIDTQAPIMQLCTPQIVAVNWATCRLMVASAKRFSMGADHAEASGKLQWLCPHLRHIMRTTGVSHWFASYFMTASACSSVVFQAESTLSTRLALLVRIFRHQVLRAEFEPSSISTNICGAWEGIALA